MVISYSGRLALVFTLVALAAPAQAGKLSSDCNGWSDTDALPAGTRPLSLEGEATLYRLDEASGSYVEVERSSSAQSVTPPATYLLSGSWSSALGGTYYVHLDLVVNVSGEQPYTLYFAHDTEPFVCTPSIRYAPRTPGYWKTHPESWPVTTLGIGGTLYSQSCLLGVLNLPTRGDARLPLIHHLIATKLNLLPGIAAGVGNTDPEAITDAPAAGSTVTDNVSAADLALAASGTQIDCSSNSLSGSAPSGAARSAIEALKDGLDGYNNGLFTAEASSGLSAGEPSAGGCSTTRGAGLEALLLAGLALLVLRRRS